MDKYLHNKYKLLLNKVIYVASDGNVKAVNTKLRLSKQLLFGPMHIKANFIS